jgi:FkbM family methyltransferase
MRPTSRQEIEQLGRAGAKAVPYSDYRILCRVLNRFKMFVCDGDETIGPHLAFDGCWEPWVTTSVCNFVKRGMVCINVGANVGYYTLIMASQVGNEGKVYAFEPNPRMFKLCKSNLRINGLENNAEIFELAASYKKDKVKFCFNPSKPGSGAITDKVLKLPSTYLYVQTQQLDEIIPKEQRIDFILIDSEGHEPQVIEGAYKILDRNNTLDILMEWSPESYEDTEKFGKVLLDFGFKPYLVGYAGELIPLIDSKLFAIKSQRMIWWSRRNASGK